jgi:hypothetical protein
MRYSVSAVSALLVLLGCTAQQVALRPEGQTPVCAVKAGERQNYWNEQAARSAGALVMFPGECPTQPGSDGGAGAGSGM